jgi:hypothetical protein
MGAELVDDLAQSLPGFNGRTRGEDAADRARHQWLLRPGDVAEHVPEKVDSAALPPAAEHLGDGSMQASMGIGNDQLHPLQPAGSQAAQERPPECFGFGLTDVQADNFAATGLMHAVGDYQGLVPDPARLTNPLHLGVQPQVGIGTGQRPLPEHADLLVKATAQPTDGVLAHAAQPELLHQPVDLAGGDPVDIGLLHHRDQRLLAAPARLQKAWEVRPSPQLGDGQLELADPGVPAAWPVAIALGVAPVRARSPSSAPVSAPTSASISSATSQATLSRSTSACSLASSLSTSSAAVILGPSAIVASPSSILGQTDDHEARGGRLLLGNPKPLLHHDPRRDRRPG